MYSENTKKAEFEICKISKSLEISVDESDTLFKMDELIEFYITTLSKGSHNLFDLPPEDNKDVLSESEEEQTKEQSKPSVQNLSPTAPK